MAMVPPIDLDADDSHAAGGRFAPRHLDRRVIRSRATLPALEGDSTMTDANQQHIALLREKSRAERGTIAELNGKLGDLKEMLKPALSQLDFVDLYFLDPKILSEDRTPQRSRNGSPQPMAHW